MKLERSSRNLWHPLPLWFREQAEENPGAVLLETAKFDNENFRTFLFADPVGELIATSPNDVPRILECIDEETAQGRYVAGFVSYECGELFQNIPSRGIESETTPLIRMGIFQAPLVFDHRSGTVSGAHTPPHAHPQRNRSAASITDCVLEIPEPQYADRIKRIQDYLAAGHSYQINFTDRIHGRFEGPPFSLYEHLIEQQPVAYAAYINCGSYQIVSLSPELFYRASSDRITVRPMKGTWPRGLNLAGDEQAAESLFHDPKNRAEHTTIVDLLRNDLGRVCDLGSVRVERFMQIERYRTLLQMTSTISGRRDPQHTPSQIFRALFPSGSITGAPKRRTMEIIRELERNPRGVYTGSIGWFGPNGHACFNVAIRTLLVRGGHYTLGAGGGITADSSAAAEYEECKLKASFLQTPRHDFHLIETMRAISGRIPLLEKHLHRLSESAEYFEISFDPDALKHKILQTLRAHKDAELRIRLTLDCEGRSAIECSPLDVVPWRGRLIIASERTDPSDVFLYHKTSHRRLYDEALASARLNGFDEVLFMNQNGFVTEGAISNIFLRTGDSITTPAIEHGVLPGVQRACILDAEPRSHTAAITLADLQAADEIWVCNALRGKRPVTTISDRHGQLLWQSRANAGCLS